MSLGFVFEQVGSAGQARAEGSSGTSAVGAQGVIRTLDGLSARGKDFMPVFERIHKSFLAAERSQFATGKGWAPDTTASVGRKIRRGQDPRTMRATGELERALTSGRGPGAVSEISSVEATFGTDLHHAVFAQRGSGRRRRRVIIVNRRRRDTWIKMVREHLLGKDKE